MKKTKDKEHKPERRIKHFDLWPLAKLQDQSAPRGAVKFPVYLSFLGAIPAHKSNDAWAVSLAYKECEVETNELIIKYLTSIAVEGTSDGPVIITDSLISRNLTHREESVAGGYVVPVGVSDDGTHIWSSSHRPLSKKIMRLNGSWEAGFTKFELRAGIAEGEAWFLPGKDFSVTIEDSNLGKARTPDMKFEELAELEKTNEKIKKEVNTFRKGVE